MTKNMEPMSGFEPPYDLRITNGSEEEGESGYEDDSQQFDNGLRRLKTVPC